MGRTDVVKLLLSRGADVNAVNKDNKTALHMAMSSGTREVESGDQHSSTASHH
jgi:ankyrin repeat protein